MHSAPRGAIFSRPPSARQPPVRRVDEQAGSVCLAVISRRGPHVRPGQRLRNFPPATPPLPDPTTLSGSTALLLDTRRVLGRLPSSSKYAKPRSGGGEGRERVQLHGRGRGRGRRRLGADVTSSRTRGSTWTCDEGEGRGTRASRGGAKARATATTSETGSPREYTTRTTTSKSATADAALARAPLFSSSGVASVLTPRLEAPGRDGTISRLTHPTPPRSPPASCPWSREGKPT